MVRRRSCAVSNHEAPMRISGPHPSRRARERAPQGEGIKPSMMPLDQPFAPFQPVLPPVKVHLVNPAFHLWLKARGTTGPPRGLVKSREDNMRPVANEPLARHALAFVLAG